MDRKYHRRVCTDCIPFTGSNVFSCHFSCCRHFFSLFYSCGLFLSLRVPWVVAFCVLVSSQLLFDGFRSGPCDNLTGGGIVDIVTGSEHSDRVHCNGANTCQTGKLFQREFLSLNSSWANFDEGNAIRNMSNNIIFLSKLKIHQTFVKIIRFFGGFLSVSSCKPFSRNVNSHRNFCQSLLRYGAAYTTICCHKGIA